MEWFLYALSAVLPALIAAVFHFLDKKVARFSRLRPIIKQSIGGVLLGGCAIGALYLSVEYFDTSLSSINASVLLSSLALGPISGSITGVMAVVARFLHDSFDSGSITQYEYPGLITTTAIAILAPLVKHFLFRKEEVSWYYGALLGATFEALWTLSFFAVFNDALKTAYEIVSVVGWRSVATVASSVGGGLLIIMLIDVFPLRKKKEEKAARISRFKLKNTLGIGLMLALAATLSLSLGAAYGTQSKAAYGQMANELTLNAQNLASSITETGDIRFAEYAKMVSGSFAAPDSADYNAELAEAIYMLPITNASFIGEDAKVAYSSDASLIGKDIRTDFEEQVADLTSLLEDPVAGDVVVLPLIEKKLVPGSGGSIGPLTRGVKYTAIRFISADLKGMILLASSISEYTKALDPVIAAAAHNRRIGESGYLFICSSASTGQFIVSAGKDGLEGKRIFQTGITFVQNADDANPIGLLTAFNEPCYYLVIPHESYFIYGIYPESEVNFQRDSTFYMIAYLLLLVVGVIFLLVFALLDWQVIGKLQRLGDKLESISGGNLETKVGRLGNEEFDRLAYSVDETVGVLRGYIDREAKRIDHDLALARDIQFGSLPSVAPLLKYHDFKIGALMTPAKEVGGDFYDFFLLPDGRLAFLIADVSDKGIPSAMFMMRAKAMIHALCQLGLPCDEVFADTNRNLIEKNDLNMFITAWLGFLDRETGALEYVNAGHNPPLLRKKWAYRYLDDDPSPVLGAFSDASYERRTLKLKPLDGLFLYTDGVTEATNAKMELFGEERLCDFLNGFADFEPEKMCDSALAAVNAFLDGSDQNDDITMVSLTYMGPYEEKTTDYPADPSCFLSFQADLDKTMTEAGLDDETRANIHVCAEEYFINIASYAYPKDKGQIRFTLSHTPFEWTLSFADSGKKFNPLAKKDPDIYADFSGRQAGGLGIYMVKQMADFVYYDYLNRQNINMFGMHTAKAKKE